MCDQISIRQPTEAENVLFCSDVASDLHLHVDSPVPGTVVSVVDLPEQVSSETLVDDMTVQEGDILMPEDRNAVQTLWSDAVVPFAISAELAYQESNIFAAFKMISDFTCIRFRRHTTEFNYLKLIDGNGCASFIGCQGGPQPLYYSRTCSVGNLCHELIHALGLHHEHTRQDRNQYVNVQWQNIIPGAKINFVVKSGNTLNLPYDLNSIMHYGKFFFSVNGNATMLPRYSTEQMGQRTHLSPLDIQKLNKLYHCDQRSTWH
ncbi:high choriolytic enzyme 1-like isoform X2 [Morone saxatilis]|uniref:high choriolytic enzyme 1-like isoform X2 n=1 Tax=Morone saxatilis TaxID=34816 RepID=UPI0015E201FE|nr:high choriolytic enzyme 1-like isoform X2 [Morone saxatilis]